MKLYFIWPPKIEYPVSTFKHLLMFANVAKYIENKFPKDKIKVLDGTISRISMNDFAKYFLQIPDFLFIQVEPHNIESALNLAKLCKSISSKTKIMFFGTAACINKKFFIKNKHTDAVNYTGNSEYAIEKYINFTLGAIGRNDLTDLVVKIKNKTIETPIGERIKPADWCSSSKFIKKSDLDLSTSPTHKSEVRIAVSRGCSFKCKFCKTNYYTPQPKKEVFKKIDDIVSELKLIKNDYNIVNLNACNFTYNKKWAHRLCDKIISENLHIKWNTMTRVDLLDEKIIEKMSKAGCYKIGIGVETLSAANQKMIGKNIKETQIYNVIHWMKKNNIIPRVCIMIGIPKQTKEEILYTYTRLIEWGTSIRSKEYYPYYELENENLTLKQIQRFDRSDFYHHKVSGLTKNDFLHFLTKNQIPNKFIHFSESAGAIIYKKNKQNILVFLLQKKDGDWYIPRGKINKNENKKETVIREVKEETGLTVKVLQKISIGQNVFWQYRKQKPSYKKVHFFLATPLKNSSVKISEDEWSGGSWVSIPKAKKLVKKRYMIDALDKAEMEIDKLS